MRRKATHSKTYPFGLLSESDYYPKAHGDIMWVFLRSLTPTEDGDGIAEYLPMYQWSTWQTTSARTFRARYRRML